MFTLTTAVPFRGPTLCREGLAERKLGLRDAVTALGGYFRFTRYHLLF